MKQSQTDKLWREEKYHVMFHSQKYYNLIRQAMRDQLDYDYIEQLIKTALRQMPTEGSMRNACQHMWGYYRKIATTEQKAYYATLLDAQDFEKILSYFKQLAEIYEVTYLRESKILQDLC